MEDVRLLKLMGKKCPRLEVSIVPTWLLAKEVVASPSLPQHTALTEQFSSIGGQFHF